MFNNYNFSLQNVSRRDLRGYKKDDSVMFLNKPFFVGGAFRIQNF